MKTKAERSSGQGQEFPEDASKWTDEQLERLLADHERDIAASRGGTDLTQRSRDEYYEKMSKYDPNDPGQDYAIKAFNLIRAKQYDDARKYLCAIREEDKNQKLAPARREARAKEGRTSTKDGSRSERGMMKPLTKMGLAVFNEMKRVKDPLTKKQFKQRLEAALESEYLKFKKGQLASYPFKDKFGRGIRCPRQAIHRYLEHMRIPLKMTSDSGRT